jgi:hypothetical protein
MLGRLFFAMPSLHIRTLSITDMWPLGLAHPPKAYTPF